MATLEEIERHWSVDCPINQNRLDIESANIPKLHEKYYKILIRELMQLNKLESDLKLIERDKWLYYSGMMTNDELKARNWQPFDIKLLHKEDKQRFIDSDREIVNQKLKYALQDEKVNFVKSILQQVNTRGYQIKNIIEWKRFENGG